MNEFPHLLRVRQNFPPTPPLDIRAALDKGFVSLLPRLPVGARVAVGVGSRGITNLAAIVTAVLDVLRAAGARPFIFPAMGSHGGATPEGQTEVLATYGITEEAMGVPIRASLDVRQVGESAEGVPVFCSTEALSADAILLVNRIKPHTDFGGALGSGLVKMCVIGLGKRAGATEMHNAASRLGYERVIRGIADVILRTAPVLGGVAILENQFHQTASLVVLSRDEISTKEDALLVESRSLMPLLPFDEIDLLIVDRIGKNISGIGMDPNVIGRGAMGYSGSLIREGPFTPFIRRIFVRDLTPETHGNAIGIGLADITTTRVVRAIDHQSTYINALTALTFHSAKIPIHFESDQEAIAAALTSLATPDPRTARIVRITDTLNLSEMEVSESLWSSVSSNPALAALSTPGEMQFDQDRNLA